MSVKRVRDEAWMWDLAQDAWWEASIHSTRDMQFQKIADALQLAYDRGFADGKRANGDH